MKEEKNFFGVSKISRYLPSLPAQRYINCCRVAGWHVCNPSYCLKYEMGTGVILLFLTLEGAGWIRSGNRQWEVREGDLAVIPPDVPIEYGTLSKKGKGIWGFYWLNLDGEYVMNTAQKLWQDNYMIHRCRNMRLFTEIFSGLLESKEPEQTRELDHSAKIQRLFHELISEILFEKSKLSSTTDEVYGNIMRFIQENYAQKISLEEMSRRFFLSKNQIIRIFKKKNGYAPYEYIKLYRLMKACELLQGTKYSVSEIGNRVGYCNSSHFAAQFHGVYGMTPTEYRNMVYFE